MTSFTQRALGLSILFLSVASGMTIARGQVYQAPDGGAQGGLPLPPPMNLPPAPSDISGGVPPLAPPPTSNFNYNSNNSINQNNFDNTEPSHKHSAANPASPPGAAYVPSEVEVFGNSSIKHGEPRAIIHTSMGDITIKLLIAEAPRSVKNFMDLARGDREFTDPRTSKKTRRPFYTNLTFHKVVADDYILGGCPLGTGHGGPGYTLPDEIAHDVKFDRPGLVAMAPAREGNKLSKDSNGSQFFIALDAQPSWDGQYTIIGEVVKGLSIANKISRTPSGPTGRPIRRVFMKTIEVAEDDSGPAGHNAPHQPNVPAPPGMAPPMAPGMAPGVAPEISNVGPASVGPASVAPVAGEAISLPPPPPALPPPPPAMPAPSGAH